MLVVRVTNNTGMGQPFRMSFRTMLCFSLSVLAGRFQVLGALDF